MNRPDSPHVIVPGWGGSGARHWQSLWERELGADRVVLADWFDARPDVWTAALDRTLDALARRDSRPPVLVAHSLGCVVVARWARTAKRAVRAALLVAPADVEREGCTAALREFRPLPRHALPFSSAVVTSDDDPYVAVARADALATAWGSDFYVVPAGGHLNADSGLGAWLEGRALLDRLLQRTAFSRAG
ncbi:MAG: alpha/beta hydrolase [Deltaproteobacteria bacterium]|nr:alpha/beta hydrolase [Deltaproteobacteria bacterium]